MSIRIDYTSAEMRAFYPSSCMSSGCGYTKRDIECTNCTCRPTLDEFEKWVADNNAVCIDPIWSPRIYTAKRAR